MPVYVLFVKAELENVAVLKLKATSYCISVREVGGDDVREGVHVDSTAEEELSGGKGTANFVMKWKDSKREASVSVATIKGLTTRPITEKDSEKVWVPTAAFECRGLEPIAFRPEGDWEVESTSGAKYTDIDLGELEWTDYDEKLGESVSVFKVQSKFELHKG